MRPALRVLGLCCIAWTVLAVPGFASTVAPPSNLGELARISRSVVLAQAMDSGAEVSGKLPVTVTRFQVLQNVAGEKLAGEIEVAEFGGVTEEAGLAVAGSAVFEPGVRYLLFLDRAANGRWQPKMLSYGILREDESVDGMGLLRPLPEVAQLQILPRPGYEPVGSYRKQELLAHLGAVAAGLPWSRKMVAANPRPESEAAASELQFAGDALHNKPAVCSFLTANPEHGSFPVRWFGFESGTTAPIFHTTPGQTGISDGGLSAVQQGIAAWNNDSISAINYSFAGTRASTVTCGDGDARERNVNEVTYNDPCNQIPDLAACGGTLPPGWSGNCCGTVALGGLFYDLNQTRSYNSETWRPAQSPFVVVNNGSQCLGETDFREMMTHNLGHGLGFGHHSDSDATMFGQLGAHPPRGAAIAAADRRCAAYAYHSFVDVPIDHFAWRFVEAIQDASITAGCGNGNYCPEDSILRETMSVFLLLAKEGQGYTPPPCTTPVFGDVPCSSPFAPWINELFARQVVVGCGGGNYCPTNPVTREQMAVFLIRTLEGPSFTPPACTTQSFNDVPCSSPFAPWIKELVDRSITAGCGPSLYCPGNPVTRAQMAVFLSVTFGLPVPTLP